MKSILFIHQSAELYGSDKVLLSLVTRLDRAKYTAIVVLPCNGPLLDALEQAGIECHIAPMVRASRATFSFWGLVQLPWAAWRSTRAISRVLGGKQIHLVHSNTLAVLSGALWARIHGIPHVWHVHEMIERPVVVRKIFGLLLQLFSKIVICNSRATLRLLLDDRPALEQKSLVVWNGVDRVQPVDDKSISNFRKSLGVDNSDVLIVMLGRINRWKGQGLLIDAAEILAGRGITNVHYLIAGSPPVGQEHFLHKLEGKIADSRVSGAVTLMPFNSDIWTVWDASDIAVVPSTEPEPFGMVAIEAMISSKPVIAANHGGLAEIVEHNVSGMLFEPGDVNQLADAIQLLVVDMAMRCKLGQNSLIRAQEVFSETQYVSGIQKCYDRILEQ